LGSIVPESWKDRWLGPAIPTEMPREVFFPLRWQEDARWGSLFGWAYLLISLEQCRIHWPQGFTDSAALKSPCWILAIISLVGVILAARNPRRHGRWIQPAVGVAEILCMTAISVSAIIDSESDARDALVLVLLGSLFVVWSIGWVIALVAYASVCNVVVDQSAGYAPDWMSVGVGVVVVLFAFSIVILNSRSAFNRLQVSQYRERLRSDQLAQTNESLRQEVKDRKVVELQLRERQQEAESLSRRILTVQEDERTRIARELHDELGQLLTAVKLAVERLRPQLPPSAEDDAMEASDLVAESIQQVRNLAMDLRPSVLEHLGLESAIRWLLERVRERTDINVSFHPTNPERRLPPDIETASYRIVQEALTNALRHAKANTIRVNCQADDDSFTVQILDDGVGFDTAQKEFLGTSPQGLGVLGIRERVQSLGGTLELRSQPGQGTTVRVRFPLLSPVQETASL
jgi:signal transduction histidine kinase